MKPSQIFQIARESGIPVTIGTIDSIEKFTSLISLHERRACAKICADAGDALWKIYKEGDSNQPTSKGSDYIQGAADQAHLLSTAILESE